MVRRQSLSLVGAHSSLSVEQQSNASLNARLNEIFHSTFLVESFQSVAPPATPILHFVRL